VRLVSKIFNLCDPDPPTLQTNGQTDRQTDGRHAISIPRYALVHRAVKNDFRKILGKTVGDDLTLFITPSLTLNLTLSLTLTLTLTLNLTLNVTVTGLGRLPRFCQNSVYH